MSKPGGAAWSLPALALLAFVLLRLLLAVLSLRDPTGGILADSSDYLILSKALVQTGQYVDPGGAQVDLVRPPGYPVFLAAVQGVFGQTSAAVTWMQLVVTGCAALALWRLGVQTSQPHVGLLAGWMLALSPNTAQWSLTVMSEALFCAVLVAGWWLWNRSCDRPSAWRFVILGLTVSAAAFVRPIGLLLIPVWAAAGFLSLRSRLGLRKALALAAICLAGALAPVLGWMARNQIVDGQFVFTTVSAKTLVGFDLAEVVARGEGITRSQAAERLTSEGGLAQFVEVAGRYPVPFVRAQLLGIARTAAGTDIGTWGNVLDYDRWAGLGLLTNLFGRSPEGDFSAPPASTGEAMLRGGLLLYSLAFAVGLWVFALLGCATLVRRTQPRPMNRMLAVVTAAVLVMAPLAAGQARFRVPAEPFLAWLAAAGLIWTLDLWRARRASAAADPNRPRPELPALQSRSSPEVDRETSCVYA